MERVSRNVFLCFVLLLGCLTIPPLVSAKTKPRRKAQTDAQYVSALSTANHFLQAWQAGDHEAGLLMLTDHAKQLTSAERLEKYFSPDSASRRAYQIANGKRLRAGRYSFPVGLFEQGPGAPSHTRYSQIIVLQMGKGDWAVETLP
jgi:hypothetical protein